MSIVSDSVRAGANPADSSAVPNTAADALLGPLSLGRRLVETVLAPLKRAFVDKDEIIDLFGVCLAGGENLFLLGPPGTAKSALVRALGRRLEGRVFDYLLTRFTEPNELFGPFDIRKLREGELVTNTEGMLPEADFAFLDELFNANSAILNSLLLALNERVFRRGRETRRVPTLMFVGASNRLPEDETLGALFDRFLLRARCDGVGADRLVDVLDAGWRLDVEAAADAGAAVFSVDDARRLQQTLPRVEMAPLRPALAELVTQLRQAGVPVSDRRAVKLQRLAAASALLCGRLKATRADLWVLRYIWDADEQREVLASLVQQAVARATTEEKAAAHPRAEGAAPDPEALARDLEALAGRAGQAELSAAEAAVLRDRWSVLAARVPWTPCDQARAHLHSLLQDGWRLLEKAPR